MNEVEVNNEVSHWFSTYGVITAERILGKYRITLEQSELVAAIKTPTSLYHHLVKVPLRNVLNGIILQQADDYHIYAQKLFIDYLLSGESAKGEEAQGAATRESLENTRQQLIYIGDEFHKIHGQHDYLIATSQAALIKTSQTFNLEMDKAIKALNATLKSADFSVLKSQIRKAIRHGLIYCDMKSIKERDNQFQFIEKMNEILKVSLTTEIKERMIINLNKLFNVEVEYDEHISEYIVKAEEITGLANSFRTQFYDTILRVIDLIKALPDYKIDEEQDIINREPLYFDNNIGNIKS